MFCLDPSDHRPLYEQIKDKLKQMMMDGCLTEHDQLPSVRELAVTLAINPNTIQKAYKDLETEGFLYSVRGKGSFVAKLPDQIGRHGRTLLEEFFKITRELCYLGVTKEALEAEMKKIYEEGTV